MVLKMQLTRYSLFRFLTSSVGNFQEEWVGIILFSQNRICMRLRNVKKEGLCTWTLQNRGRIFTQGYHGISDNVWEEFLWPERVWYILGYVEECLDGGWPQQTHEEDKNGKKTSREYFHWLPSNVKISWINEGLFLVQRCINRLLESSRRKGDGEFGRLQSIT